MTTTTIQDELIAQVLHDLGKGGTLAAQLPGYRERPAQLALASQVAEALAGGTTCIAEAGTGIGKSLGYLIPAVRSGKVTVVSTSNKSLQEQLFFKDIPFLQTHLASFEAAFMKGMGNYVCLDRMAQARADPEIEGKPAFSDLLATLGNPTWSGDLESLPFTLPAEIRGRINGDSDECAGKQCEYYASCYISAMRERVKQASVIVVNHSLLLLDAVLSHALLPDHDVIIVDEAHHLEAEATAAFTLTVKPRQVSAFLNARLVQECTSPELRETIKALNLLLWQQVEQLPFNTTSRLLLVQPIAEAFALASKLEDLLKELRINRPSHQDEKDAALYDKLLERGDTLARKIRQACTPGKPNEWVSYAERVPRTNGTTSSQVCLAPLDVAPFLREKVFDEKPTILVSATLATGTAQVRRQGRSPFVYFRERVGLDRSEVQECVLPHVFEYQRNALLYLPSPQALPEPVSIQNWSGEQEQHERYLQKLTEEMWSLVQASRGRAFLLFASRRMLDECYARLGPRLSYPLWRQGELPRAELVRRFREEQGSVLFGLKSFWEGVDIVGDALSLVVIDKLPFAPPDDPVEQGRVKRMRERGQNWFGEFVLPRVIIDLKQGMGRLLRTDTDRGVVALLDTRLSTKGYGRQVLDELPPARRTHTLEDVRAFFHVPTGTSGVRNGRVC